jgi:hypothetical protein
VSKFGFDLLFQQCHDFLRSEYECAMQEVPGDSEIEKLFFMALWMRVRIGACEYRELLVAREAEKVVSLQTVDNASVAPKECRLILQPQVKIANRRVDFVLYAYDWRNEFGPDPKPGEWRRLIIECDGHNFHERTKEQAAKDRAKDRQAVLDGVDCFRFTGSELWRDPWACAEQVTDWAIKGWF